MYICIGNDVIRIILIYYIKNKLVSIKFYGINYYHINCL